MISKPAISIKEVVLPDIVNPYLAGLIDGEGYIYIVKGSVKKSKVYMRMGVKIAMIDNSFLLSRAQKVWGGYIRNRKARSDKHRATVEWIIQDLKAERLLNELLSFLILKKDQAKIAIEFRKFVSKNNMVTKNIENYRNHLSEGLKGLHHSIPFEIDKNLRRKATYDQKHVKWHISEEHRKKLSESHKGLLVKNMFKKGHVPWTKGRKFTEEHKRKIGLANSLALKKFYARVKA